MLGAALYFLLNLDTLSGMQQVAIVLTVVVMSIQNGFILSQSKLALALEGPRLLMFPLLWIASGIGFAAWCFALSSVVGLVMLLFAVRYSNYRRPIEEVRLSTEPENLA